MAASLLIFGMQYFVNCLFMYACLAFVFRATTLHLRPVDAEPSSHRLTIFSLLGLTAIVAMGLSIDGFKYQLYANEFASRYELSLWTIALRLLSELTTAILWLSAAWIFVARNTKKWWGVLGLVAYLLFQGIYCLLIAPMWVDQTQVPAGITLPKFGIEFYLGSLAIKVFQMAIVFLCVGAMHLVGYRWDIHRPIETKESDAETPNDCVPPLLDSRPVSFARKQVSI